MTFRVLGALICLLGVFQLIGQAPKEHPKKFHRGEDGKLYWQADKPVYLFLSEHPDGKDANLLKSESTPEYGDPLYLDSEGLNHIVTRWAVDTITRKPITPQLDIEFEVYRDGLAPRTRIDFRAPNRFEDERGIYYGRGLTVSASSEDALSGVTDTYYSENQGDFQSFTNSLTYETDGDYLLSFYAVDKVGNVESNQDFAFTVDLSQPETNYGVRGDKYQEVLSPRTEIRLEGRDNSSGINDVYYKFDDQEVRPFRDVISVASLEEGEHVLTYYSTDNVNNEEAPNTYEFYLDRKAPEVVASVVGEQYQNRGRVFISTRTKVKLVATDNKAGISKIWYKIDDGQETPYVEPFELPRTPGKHIIEYYASDRVNNDYRSLFDESASGREALDIDVDAPIINFEFDENQYFSRDTAFITSETDISLSAFDEESGIKSIGYKINGGKGTPYEGPFRITDEGTYVVDFFGADEVNNRNSKEFFFTVDNTGPQIQSILSMKPIGSIVPEGRSQALKVYTKGVKLYLAATDDVVDTEAIYYTINNATEEVYDMPITLSAAGIVTYSVRAIDNLGNETSSEVFEIFVQ